MNSIALSSIRIDGGTQMRADLDDAVSAEYAQVIRDGADFPPVVLFFDGSNYWLGDGFHRFHAYRTAGAIEIPADVREGTKRDAILHAVGANAHHGLRRSPADKRKAVQTLLSDDEWSGWSDREIGRQCAVDHKTVGRIREEYLGNSPDARTVSRGGQTYQQNTANIGKAKSDAEGKTTPPASKTVQDAADRAEQDAARRAEQTERDRQREEHRAALPEHIRQHEAAKVERAANAGDSGISPELRIAELEEAVSILEEANATLKEENALYEPMRVQFEAGGFEKVIAGKDEEIRVLKLQVETESADKVSWMRSAKRWEKEAKGLGWVDTNTVTISTRTGEIRHG